jgi:hypothetical protein
MSEQTFNSYILEPDVHDGVIVGSRYKSGFLRSVFNRRVVSVVVLTDDDRLFSIVFGRVSSASITNAKGMRLHSFKETYATPPFRRFLFVSSEEKSNHHFEVVARELSSVELTADFVPREAVVHLRNLYPRQR